MRAIVVERVLRAAAIAAIAWLLWTALRPVAGERRAEASGEDVGRSVAEWVRDPLLAGTHAALEDAPADSVLDALVALRRTGVEVSWSGEVPAFALSVVPVPEPGNAQRIAIAAPADVRVAVTDALGLIDTLAARSGGGELLAAEVASSVRASVGRASAVASGGGRARLRPVLVVGRAGWESKFVIAALEERGWTVRARVAVAPGVLVRQGADAPLDTARLSAVVVLDSSAAAMAEPLRRYVRSGGGLVIAGGAATHPALGALAPARTGTRMVARARLVADSISPRTLTRYRLAALRDHGVALDRGGAEVLLAARREGAGRVAQTGLEDSWRWRMEGGEGSADAHRRYWSRLVASVAYAPVETNRTQDARSPAPRARLVDALGAPRAARAASVSFDPLRHLLVLGAVLALLLAEWFSRRLRGAK